MKNTTLVIMAAGIGSRFGDGVKQLAPLGPYGEVIMDYSIHDALKAGFNKIIFIIRRDLEHDFRRIIGSRIERIADVEYAYQEVNDVPMPFKDKWMRKKPWGTGQAVLSLRGLITEPFAVINADDYYGKEAFARLHDYMVCEMKSVNDRYDICMAGFILSNTLSANGGVTRGICSINEAGQLTEIKETYEIQASAEGVLGKNESGNPVVLSPDSYVSMNMWGLPPGFLNELESGFADFLRNLKPDDVSSEYLLPQIIDHLLKEKNASVKLLETRDQWFGVTYKTDKETIVRELKRLEEEEGRLWF